MNYVIKRLDGGRIEATDVDEIAVEDGLVVLSGTDGKGLQFTVAAVPLDKLASIRHATKTELVD